MKSLCKTTNVIAGLKLRARRKQSLSLEFSLLVMPGRDQRLDDIRMTKHRSKIPNDLLVSSAIGLALLFISTD